MKSFYKISTAKAQLLALLSFVLLFSSACREEINMENRYTFTGETVLSFLEENDSLFGNYTDLLKAVKQSDKTESSVATLLSVTTNSYTCFAPTNEAVQIFLDSAYVKGVFSSNDFTIFLDSVKAGSAVSDSLAEVIVFNSIIQKGLSTDEFPSEENATLPLPNLKDRYLTVRRDNDSITHKEVLYILDDVRVIYSNIELYNGYIHGVDKVVSPSTDGVSDIFLKAENMQLFGRLLKLTGWSDLVAQTDPDLNYEQIVQNRYNDLNNQNSDKDYLPEHRKYGFTIFAETDETLTRALSLSSPDELIEKLNDYLRTQYSGMSGVTFGTSAEDLRTAENAINQFVAYHILPVSLSSNNLVYHYNEKDYDKQSGRFGVPVFEFYETMSMAGGPRRLLKIYESKSSGKRLNRKGIMDNETYQEIGADPKFEGIKIGGESGAPSITAMNGYVYPIEEVLVYTNETATGLFRDRLRFDMASLFPELVNLGYRRIEEKIGGKADIFFPSEFATVNFQRSNDTRLRYLSGQDYKWSDYQGDEIMLKGNYDFTLKLPPVPFESTYEVRLGFNGTELRGMCQIYFAEEGNSMMPTDIPLDLRMKGTSAPVDKMGLLPFNVGWEQETDDSDYNNRVNKALRTKGWMKGPRYFYSEYAYNNYKGEQLAYNHPNVVRKVLTKQPMEPNKTYYIRFKSVLDDKNTELQLDYIELVPSEIYNNPIQVEDEW